MTDHLEHVGQRMKLRDGTVTDTPLRETGSGGTHCLTAKVGGRRWLWTPEGWWGRIGTPTPHDLIEPAPNGLWRT